MSNWYMLTVVGSDQVGIVARLTDVLYRNGCNLGEAAMMRLGGNFTVMVMVRYEGSAEELQALLQEVAGAFDLRVHVDPIRGELHRHVVPETRITVYGADRAGIVAEVTAVLAREGFNILDLESDVAGTEQEPLYILHIEGAGSTVEALDAALAPVRERGVSVQVTPIETLVG